MTDLAQPTSALRDGVPGGSTSAGFAIERLRRWPAIAAIMAVAAMCGAVSAGHPPVVLGLVALVAGLAILARPQRGAVVAVALAFSNATVIASSKYGLPEAVALVIPLLLLVVVAYDVCTRRLPLRLPRSGLWAVAFVLVELLGALTSRDPTASIQAWTGVFTEGLVMFLLLTNAVRGFELVRAATIALVMTAALLGTVSVAQNIGVINGDAGGFGKVSNAVIAQGDHGVGGSQRRAGPIGEQNRWAQDLAVVLPLAVAMALTDRSRLVRRAMGASAIGIGAGMVLTFSRGAVVGLILTALIAVFAGWIRPRVALSAAAVVVVVLVAGAPVFASRASTLAEVPSAFRGPSDSSQATDGSFDNRAVEGSAAFAVFSRHPLLGVGTGQFPTYFQDEARRLGAPRIVGVNREAHSLYLGLAAETGLLGLLTFAGLIVALQGPLVRLRRRATARRPDVAGLATGYALAVTTYLTTGIFLHFAYIRYFWLFIGLAAAMGMVSSSDASADPSSPLTLEKVP
ncbi:MAG: O-antigen ligase family protein [Aquihabitans sp.]